MPNYQEAETNKKSNPYIALMGFIIIVLVGGVSYLAAPMLRTWLTTTTWFVAGTRVLPIRFPAWDLLTQDLAVAAGMFLVLFAVVMILLLVVMGSPAGPTDVSLQEIRAEKKRKEKQRMGR